MKLTAQFVSCSIFIGLVISSCNNFSKPPTMWDPNQQYPAGAIISAVVPSGSAIAGVREITIVGKNFSAVADSNWVWFGTQQAIVKRVTINSSADTIVAYRPPISGPLTLKLVIPSADSVGTCPYNLETPVSSSDISSIAGTYLAMEAGSGDTIWIASTGYITKLSPDGVNLSVYRDTSYLKPKISNKSTDFSQTPVDLKFGPGGFLYETFNKTSTLYRLDPDSVTPVVYVNKFPGTNSVGNFDFDNNGNLYTGRSNGMFLGKRGVTPTAVGDYSGMTFVDLRVIKTPGGTKYVYAASASNLYRSAINSDGTLQPKELLYSITTDTSFGATCKISSFNLSSDGDVLVSVTGTSNYSLFVLTGGALTSYYRDNILPTGIDQLVWGTDRFVYLSRGKTSTPTSTRFYKMGMARQDGTPLSGAAYIGRGL